MPAVKKVAKKTMKAEKKSHNVAAEFINALKKKENVGEMFLVTVTKANGGGRFVVIDDKKVSHTVHVSPTLFLKVAGKRNVTTKVAVLVGSHVIVNGDIITAVVGDSNAVAIRKLNMPNNSNNNIFSRIGGSRG